MTTRSAMLEFYLGRSSAGFRAKKPQGTSLNPASWTGINPDEDVNLADQDEVNGYPPPDDPNLPWARFRQGQFTGSIDLTILSLASEARDRFFDTLTMLILLAGGIGLVARSLAASGDAGADTRGRGSRA